MVVTITSGNSSSCERKKSGRYITSCHCLEIHATSLLVLPLKRAELADVLTQQKKACLTARCTFGSIMLRKRLHTDPISLENFCRKIRCQTESNFNSIYFMT